MSSIGQYESLGVLIAQVNRAWRRAIDDCLSPLGLTEATWRPLIYISRASQPLSQNDLADLLSLDRSSVVRLLDALESSGFVVRQEDVEDRRVKRLHLTPQGKEAAEQAEKASRTTHERIFSSMAPELLKATRSGLLEMLQLLDRPGPATDA